MKLITMGNISVFESKTVFQAMAAAAATATKIYHKLLSILKNYRMSEIFISRKSLILHVLGYEERKFHVV